MENTQQPQQSQENITLADLDLIKNIIDLACTRGAFRGSEVRQVGEVYEKLTAFLEAVVAQAQNQEVSKDGEESQGE